MLCVGLAGLVAISLSLLTRLEDAASKKRLIRIAHAACGGALWAFIATSAPVVPFLPHPFRAILALPTLRTISLVPMGMGVHLCSDGRGCSLGPLRLGLPLLLWCHRGEHATFCVEAGNPRRCPSASSYSSVTSRFLVPGWCSRSSRDGWQPSLSLWTSAIAFPLHAVGDGLRCLLYSHPFWMAPMNEADHWRRSRPRCLCSLRLPMPRVGPYLWVGLHPSRSC